MKRKNISIEEFEAMAVKAVEEKFGDNVIVGLRHERKEDIVELHGLMITDTLLDLTQMIYLNTFYEACPDREYIEATIEKIIESYEYNLKVLQEMMKECLEWYRNFENVKDHIYYRLIEQGEFVESIIYEKYMDMNKLYYVYDRDQKIFKDGYIIIQTTHLRMWNITAEEIKDIAEKNMQKQPVEIVYLLNMLDKKLTIEEQEIKEDSAMPEVYILRNTELEYGASAMCNKEVIRGFAEEHKADIFIIPSSISEVTLIINKWKEEDCSDVVLDFKDALNELNTKTLDHDDVLSNSIYMYRRSTDKIEILK